MSLPTLFAPVDEEPLAGRPSRHNLARRAAGIEKVDAEGRVVDFHALRTTFISWLGMTGVHPRMAQALARHASIETTLGTYTDLRLFDSKGAVANLPLPGTARDESSAASA